MREHGEQPVHLVEAAARLVGVAANQPSGDAQVLVDAEAREDGLRRHHREAVGGLALRGGSGDVLAVEHDAAAGGRHSAGDPLEQGGLARAVGAEQGDDLTLADLELRPEQDLESAVLHLHLSAAQQDIFAFDVADLDRLDGRVDATGAGCGRREVDAAAARDDAEQAVADGEQRGRQAAGQHEQDEEQAAAGDEQLVLREQVHGELDGDDTDQCAADRAEATDDDHRENQQALRRLVGAVADALKDHRVQATRHAGDCTRQHERQHLDPRRGHGHRRRCPRVVTGGQHHATRT